MTGNDHSWLSDGYAAVSDDLTLYYQTAGCGATGVIFVPGWTMASQVFEHQLRHLARSEQFTAAAYDPRAQGRSTITTNGHYYEQHARDLRGLIEQLGFEHYILIGWSAGGCEILEYLRLYGPDRLRGLALLDIPPRIRGRDRAADWVEFGTGDDGDQDGYAETGIDENVSRLVAPVEVGGPAETKIDRYQHQSRGMRDRHGEGPEPELRRSYPREHPRMAPVDQPESAKPDDQEAGADLDLSLPLDNGSQQREGKDHHEHRQQMAERKRPKCCHEGVRTPFH